MKSYCLGIQKELAPKPVEFNVSCFTFEIAIEFLYIYILHVVGNSHAKSKTDETFEINANETKKKAKMSCQMLDEEAKKYRKIYL